MTSYEQLKFLMDLCCVRMTFWELCHRIQSVIRSHHVLVYHIVPLIPLEQGLSISTKCHELYFERSRIEAKRQNYVISVHTLS